MVTMLSVLLGFGLGALTALYTVWIGLRWSAAIRTQAPIAAPSPASVAQEAVGTPAEEPDGVRARAAEIMHAWFNGKDE